MTTCKALPNLFPGEEGLLDELASRGCDPQIKVWNDPDVDWADAGMVVVRSVSDYAADRPAFLEWTRQLRRVQNSKDVLNWNTDKHYLKELAAMGLPTAVASVLIAAFTSAFMIGGKAAGKSIAIEQSANIVLFVGKTMALFERKTTKRKKNKKN